MWDKSETTARFVLTRYLELMEAELAPEIDAVILVGSLVYGSYMPGPGDIDQITILKDSTDDESLLLAQRLTKLAMAEHDNSVNLSDVIYRISDLRRPWLQEWDGDIKTRHIAHIPEELLRIHDHGQILYADLHFSLDELPNPSFEEILKYRRRCRRWNALHTKNDSEFVNVSLLPHLAAQSILVMAIWHHYYATGKPCFNKHQILIRAKESIPNYRFFYGLELATKLRMGGSNNLSINEKAHLDEAFKEMLRWNHTHEVGSIPVSY